MKNKGFTLIELLAVIVVLAIIALIATPIVMNLIKDAEKGAAERSAENYIRAVEIAIATDRLDNPLIEDGEYIVDADGNLVSGTKTLIVEVSGDKPDAGSKIAIQNGQVVHTGTTLNYDEAYTVTLSEDGKATASEIVISTKCTLEDLDNNDTASLSDLITCGSESFYVISNDGTNINMLAKNNLSVGYALPQEYNGPETFIELEGTTGLQATENDPIGYDIFSDYYYWVDNEYVILDEYATPKYNGSYWVYNSNSKLKGYLDFYQDYMKKYDDNVTVTLISAQQLTTVGCTISNGFSNCANALSWVKAGPDFWTGSASEYMTLTRGGCATAAYSPIGVRPVVVISSDAI